MGNLYKNHNNKINVVIHQNYLSEDENSYYGRVTRNTVTLEQLIKGILDDNQNTNTGLNAYILNFAMDRMKSRILAEIKAGNAVSLLDLGTMYLTLKGSFTMNSENSDISALKGNNLSVGFTPSEEIQNAVSHLKVGSISLCLKAPSVNSIVNLSSKKEAKILSAGKCVELKGTRLKVLGENSGIFFAPINSSGETENDESKWIKVPNENLLKNYPKSLIFQVPLSLAEGKYAIAIRTSYCGGSYSLKELATGFCSVIEIVS